MTDTLLDPLNRLQLLSQNFFQSLSPTQGKQTQPPPISTLIAVDEALASAVKLARTHQVKQRKIERFKDELLTLEEKWREIVQELEQGKQDLEILISEGDERVKSIEQAKAASIPYPELLAYAQSISSFTSAPPNMPDLSLPGQPPPPLFFPPFPNEEKMRRGHMNSEAPLGPLGETHSVGHAPSISPKKSVELPPHMAGPGANPYRPDHRGPQHLQIFDLDLDLNPDL
ncbi:vitamin-D-receptor interacting mediator subunit 4-domain-containing protein [Abortiporus biennis]|nr:vitamin-D-receptor interacting mediator subunit 4-domain-containing protein [Abortiporus biennis]